MDLPPAPLTRSQWTGPHMIETSATKEFKLLQSCIQDELKTVLHTFYLVHSWIPEPNAPVFTSHSACWESRKFPISEEKKRSFKEFP